MKSSLNFNVRGYSSPGAKSSREPIPIYPAGYQSSWVGWLLTSSLQLSLISVSGPEPSVSHFPLWFLALRPSIYIVPTARPLEVAGFKRIRKIQFVCYWCIMILDQGADIATVVCLQFVWIFDDIDTPNFCPAWELGILTRHLQSPPSLEKNLRTEFLLTRLGASLVNIQWDIFLVKLLSPCLAL